jgi:hypothetical protein
MADHLSSGKTLEHYEQPQAPRELRPGDTIQISSTYALNPCPCGRPVEPNLRDRHGAYWCLRCWSLLFWRGE